jgi:hypothetical protein
MLKTFYCNRCMRHLTQDKKSKVHNCCDYCELTITTAELAPKVDRPASFVRVNAHTTKHKKKMNELAYERELKSIKSDDWMND